MPLRIWREPLDIDKVEHPEAEIHIIKERCKGCNFCIAFCPMKVLEESDEINEKGFHPPRVVDESKCVLCSFCSAVCPDFAIFVIEKAAETSEEEAEEIQLVEVAR
ncbi:MAG: 4Fe-4S dicluster domain-containing protein [Candidatus Bathyarchaeota archaeon]|nr:MAG: 4Fe-4S dicluster domain-containing protein [Candidatus Bathyarchaeota archaeon]